jgi:hypothetical protein
MCRTAAAASQILFSCPQQISHTMNTLVNKRWNIKRVEQGICVITPAPSLFLLLSTLSPHLKVHCESLDFKLISQKKEESRKQRSFTFVMIMTLMHLTEVFL